MRRARFLLSTEVAGQRRNESLGAYPVAPSYLLESDYGQAIGGFAADVGLERRWL